MRRSLVLAFLVLPALAQAQPVENPDAALQAVNPVAATPASDRAGAYVDRRTLESASLLANVPFRSVGPRVMSGRVADLEASPFDPATFYVAYASGGLWKTTANGTAFTPLFDTYPVMTIGDIAVDWSDPEGDGETIWIGTGESNSSRSSYAGDGLYRSEDGGQVWQHRGLDETHHIGRIVIHPEDPNTVWVAAVGHLYSPNEERGVYRTTDGGETWERTLFVDANTGAIDLVIDPDDPDRLWAAMWTRARRAWDFSEAGEGSGIYRSDDGGTTWVRVSTPESGFPTGPDVGRIGLAVAPGHPGHVVAILDNQARRPDDGEADDELLTRDALRAMSRDAFLALAEDAITDFLDRNGYPLSYTAQSILEMVRDGTLAPLDLVTYLEDANQQLFDTPVVGAEVYRSTDGGATWTRTHADYLDDLVYSYGYYFGQIRVAPQDPDRLYILGVPILKSEDGGATWVSINEANVHVDHHALYVSPTRPGHLINGNDGGINVSFDDGATWSKANVPAVGQFYTVAVDMAEPYHVYGGLQDNGVWVGPSSYEADDDWLGEGHYPYERLLGGDGMQVAIDPRTNRTVYTGFQFGNYFRIDRDDDRTTRITPRHELGERPLRFNWQAPIHLSTHNPDVLYFGSNKVHRSLDRGETWETLSGDLTEGGLPGDVPYGTLTTFDESPLRFGLLWVGSDDGLVHVSRDGGYSWQNVSAGMPGPYWVSRVEASHHEEGRAYVTLNGYRWDAFEALVFRTDDYGQSWARVGDDLPMEPVNVLAEDPDNADVLYVGTDHGVYVSLDGGASFGAMRGQGTQDASMPNAPVHDLVVHPRDADLVVGTHGRSIWIADIAPVQQLTDSVREEALHVFGLDEVRRSDRWGTRGYTWGEPFEPEVTLVYWAKAAGPVTLSVDGDDGTVHTWTDEADAGLNYVAYGLLADEAMDEDHEPGEDTGAYYLLPGDYTITLTQGEATVSTTLRVNEPPAPPVRGRKKTP